MNLNNSKYNYARKFKAILKYVLFAVPLIMVLVAVLFPIKISTNTYDGSITSVTETTSSIYFNQYIKRNVNVSLNGGTYVYDNDSNSYTFTAIDNSYNYSSLNITLSSPCDLIGNYSHKYYVGGSIEIVSLANVNASISLVLNNGLTQSTNRKGNLVVGEVYNMDSIQTLASSGSNFQSLIAYIPHTNKTPGDCFILKNPMLIDLSLMYGYGNEPTLQEFHEQFPLDYYEYNSGELLMLHEVETTTTINDTDKIWYTTDCKQLNTSLLTPMTEFYGASINSWYESFLTAFELNYDTTSYLYYLVHMPLWIMYVVLLDLFLDIVLLIPCLLHRLVYKYKGDD